MIYKRIFAVFLSVLFVLPVMLVSCTGNTAVTDTDSATETDTITETETETEPLPEEKKMVLINDSTPAFYTSQSEAGFCTGKINRFEDAISYRYGCRIPDKAKYCVSFSKDESLDGWRIKADEKGISITASSSSYIGCAVDEFLRRFTCGSSFTLAVPETLDISYDYKTDKIDNSSLLSYIPTDKVKLLDTTGDGKIMSPEWIESLVIVELRIVTASIGGYLKDSYDLLDFYAETGVNCLWLTPIYEYGPGGNGYGNTGAHKIGENLTGTSDQAEGWEEMRKFVEYAHNKGIYILFDVITWGVMKGTELTKEHPDWFSGEAWGNAAFNWKNEELKEWFISTCVENIEKTGADGFRCDCEPNYTGYAVYGEIRQRLADKGKYIIIISEDGSRRNKTYDFEQDGVLWYAKRDRGGVYANPTIWFVDGGLDIIDAVKNGTGLGSAELQNNSKRAGKAKYYTNCITNHDYQKRIVLGNRLNIGYAAITAPFIPLWYMGDEFNCDWRPAVQYDLTVNYADADKPENRLFYEDVKRMIAVRRTYPEIFEYWADDHRNANICEVKLKESKGLTAYARYADNKAVLILPNNDAGKSPYITAEVPIEDCGIYGRDTYYRVTDLWSGEVLYEADAEHIKELTVYVPYQNFGMILIEGIEYAKPES